MLHRTVEEAIAGAREHDDGTLHGAFRALIIRSELVERLDGGVRQQAHVEAQRLFGLPGEHEESGDLHGRNYSASKRPRASPRRNSIRAVLTFSVLRYYTPTHFEHLQPSRRCLTPGDRISRFTEKPSRASGSRCRRATRPTGRAG